VVAEPLREHVTRVAADASGSATPHLDLYTTQPPYHTFIRHQLLRTIRAETNRSCMHRPPQPSSVDSNLEKTIIIDVSLV
jgi:hypothetical protein